MARRSNRTLTGVRGPNSALTEFLRVEGITDAFRRRQERDDSASREQSPTDRNDTEESEIPLPSSRLDIHENIVNEEEDEEERAIRQAARRKRKAANRRLGGGFPSESDSDDDDDKDYSDDDVRGNGFKKFGEEDNCVDCGKIFNMTVYSRYDRARKGYLCEACNENLKQREKIARRNQLNARKKRKKVAQALLDKSSVQMPTLQDICIKKITQNIDDVDALGDIGQTNMNKISMILSKNRSLNNSTMTLFLHAGLKELEFWDCSNVDSDSLNKIASYCPNLESLTLFMCGHFHNDNLKYFDSNLPHLADLSLNGPFLISDAMWQEYFENGGSRLSKFEIRNTHRFGNDSLISLLENCGSKLTKLKLSRLDGLDSAPVYDLIPHYLLTSTLTSLEISYPYKEELITDDLLINILSITGESLTSLNVDGCSNLTDRFLSEGVVRFCPNLTHLSLKLLDQLTDEGFAAAFRDYSKVNSGGLINVQLTKCTGLGNNAIHSLLNYSAQTLVELSLNSIYNVDKDFLFQIFTDDHHPLKIALKDSIDNSSQRIAPARSDEENNRNGITNFYSRINFPLLTTLDIGFVRAVDDEILNFISDNCSKLTILETYGNNRCTLRANVRNDLMVIGRQNDIL
ncbi:uncharacterized protein AC631_01203 [Debaryomyces fabryi]|uniref:DNA repair protein rhp7 treble clef domain-containing protein n=1 Tax=Debaryomyces fabryi TaxID=58627 RepID=A0A0V1Q3J1_9ASCO|nr:uncharacterized protein AC631_01203 [Debaryomyces fabryi]KSA03069.1 hypothetical protein AC631_01203 [Debaryomyces fabryi]CUM49118.1 unnamed protein product [Debaryomyces fabryi]